MNYKQAKAQLHIRRARLAIDAKALVEYLSECQVDAEGRIRDDIRKALDLHEQLGVVIREMEEGA